MAVAVVAAALRPLKLLKGARDFASVDVSLLVLVLRDMLRMIGPPLNLAGLGAVRQPRLLLFFAIGLLDPALRGVQMCHHERRVCRRLLSIRSVLVLMVALPLRLPLFWVH